MLYPDTIGRLVVNSPRLKFIFFALILPCHLLRKEAIAGAPCGE